MHRRVIATAALALALAALVTVIARGDPDPPMTAESLATSVAKESSGLDDGECRRVDDTRWVCTVPSSGGSSIADYEVTATSEDCWEARLDRAYGDRSLTRLSGCL